MKVGNSDDFFGELYLTQNTHILFVCHHFLKSHLMALAVALSRFFGIPLGSG